jgi:diguanylate cyclase (GGDEF)-like protein/PAS domain S-box-containing protein
VRAKPASRSIWSRLPRRRGHGFAARMVSCFLLITLATVVVRLTSEANHLIWVANGVLLAYMLLAPRRRWAAYLAIAFVAQTAGSILVNTHWQLTLMFTALNMGEVLLSAHLLRRWSTAIPRFTNRAYLIRFIAFGVVAGPLATGLIYAVIAALWLHAAPGFALLQWAAADGLGTGVTTPACIAIFRTRFKDSASFKTNWYYLPLVAAASIAVFSQVSAPVPFILYPLLLLVLLRLGLGWSAVATLFAAAVGSWYTCHGEGPFASSITLTHLEPTILLQVFISSAMFMLYSVSVVVESLRSTEHRLQRIALRHALVTENSRDAIIIADFNGLRRYVSPAGERLSGWTTEEIVRQGSTGLVHPEDLPGVNAAISTLRSGAEGAMIECRVRKRDGEYIWVEASLWVVSDAKTSLPSGILNIVRDITERKQAQQKLQEAYRAVEELAITDSLTGLANRRRFDQCLTAEWRRGLRERRPLSLLLLDADLFKSFNDSCGHLRGDNCLKQIAESAMDVVTRPGDVVARFGGEEFAIILPNTGNEGAMQVANEACEALRSRNIPHQANPHGMVTVSIGCATVVPSLGKHALSLIELADKALYEAKRRGRNRVCSANVRNRNGDESITCEELQPSVARAD